ncbi:MAG: DNA-directed RNA polymerase subunit H [Candidatus Thorarchaeota archaeon]
MVELPSIVIKTRSLLTLRGYVVEEVLEYEDRYILHPVRETASGPVKLNVWILKEPKVIGVAIVREVVREMEEGASQGGMIVGGSRFTPASKKHARLTNVELVEGGYASFDLFEHDLVPKHIIAEESEVQMVLDHYGIAKPQLPRILRDDPAAKVLGARPGQVLRIERESPTAGRTYYYRLVIDSGR